MHGTITLRYYDNEHYKDLSHKLEKALEKAINQDIKLSIIGTEFFRDEGDEHVTFEFIVHNIELIEKK